MSDHTQVRALVEQTDGRLTIADKGDMTLRVTHPRCQPLSEFEEHATLRLSKQGTEIELRLNRDALKTLVGELSAVADGEVWADA